MSLLRKTASDWLNRRPAAWKILPALLLLSAVGCDSGRHSSAGFRLPDDGSVERGKIAFLSLECNRCHEVSGVDLPRPTVQPAVPVILGGPVTSEVPDGYLVTSIINPSHRFAPYPKELITVGGKSRMPEYEQITARQLADIVAFLQSRYTVRRGSPKYPYF
ncbi:MAG: c-type cytochrome [Bryobacteraceae bacterium]